MTKSVGMKVSKDTKETTLGIFVLFLLKDVIIHEVGTGKHQKLYNDNFIVKGTTIDGEQISTTTVRNTSTDYLL